MVTLAEAIKSGRLQEFAAQEEARGIGPIDRAEFENAIGAVVEPPRYSVLGQSGVMLAARAGPPFLPIADAAGSTPRSSGVRSRSSTCPVRISTMSLAS